MYKINPITKTHSILITLLSQAKWKIKYLAMT